MKVVFREVVDPLLLVLRVEVLIQLASIRGQFPGSRSSVGVSDSMLALIQTCIVLLCPSDPMPLGPQVVSPVNKEAGSFLLLSDST